MKKILNDRRILLKILSGFIAVVLWFAITYTEDPVITQVITGIPLNFVGEDKLEDNGLIVVNKNSLPEIAVAVRGTRSNVIAAIGSVTAEVDVSGITNVGSIGLPIKYMYPTSGIALVKSRTDEITIEAEKLVTRSIPMRAEAQNTDKNTQYIVKTECVDDRVKVRGAESSVYAISYGRADVDVSALEKSGVGEYEYAFFDGKGNRLPEGNILYRSSDTLSVKNTVYKRVNVPVKLIPDDETDELYAMTVKNQSMSSTDIGVADGTEITELTAVITREDEKTEYETAIDVPDGVYVPEKSRTVAAVCVFEPKMFTEVKVPVTITGAPDGKTAEADPKEITVSVKCAEKDASPERIRASADVSELTEGSGKIAVTVTAEDGITVIGAYSVHVRLIDAEKEINE